MKKINKLLLFALIILLFNSCTDDFAETNTNPNAITKPNIDFIFAEVLRNTQSKYTDWYINNYQGICKYTQLTVPSAGNDQDFNKMADQNSLWNLFYSVGNNTTEIRHLIDGMSDGEKIKYEKIYFTTYIPEIYLAMKVSDQYGSMPYSEAFRGKYEGIYNGKFDTQLELYTQWDQLLKEVEQKLSSASSGEIVTFGNGDWMYKNKWNLWAKTANALRYRIAERLINIDPDRAKAIVNEVNGSLSKVYETKDEQWMYDLGSENRGEAYDKATTPVGSINMINWMKSAKDPRLRVFWRTNDLSAAALDSCEKYSIEIPSFIDVINDPLYRYQGVPARPRTNADIDYFNNLNAGPNVYRVNSEINYRLVDPRKDGGTGYMIEPLITFAEVKFLQAEFIIRGFMTGDAADTYNKAVLSSLTTYDQIAKAAKVIDYVNLTASEVDAYISDEAIAFSGTNLQKLEKIAIQQYANFFRQPWDAWVLMRRTGFPATNSSLLAYEPMVQSGTLLPTPRRFGVLRPNDLLYQDYLDAMSEQGFTPERYDPELLSSQKLWFDKNSPVYGGGAE